MVLIPVNMSCFVLILVPVKKIVEKNLYKVFCFIKLSLFYKIVPPWTILKNIIFCKDLLKKQNIL